jgi:hypothetical protein
MSRFMNIFGGLVLLGATVAAYGEFPALRPHVTEGDIIEAMREKGVIVCAGQVSMLSTIPVRTKHPVLEALKIEQLSADASRVLIRCADRSSCIPFYAVVNGLAPNEQTPGELLNGQGAVLQKPASGPVLVKRGSTATLEIVAPDMLITLPVVCLQNGRQGERIRVSSIDRKKTYLGEIVRPGLLRSRL